MEITTTTIRLRAPDGEMKCHQAQPRGRGRFPAVIVVMEAFGLNDHIKDVTERISREGYVAIAPDLYYRQAQNVVGYEQLQAAIGLMQTLVDDKITADLRAVINHLQAQTFVQREHIGITGFCMGGRIAFLAACKFPAEIKAAIPFYGGSIAADTPTAPLNFASDLKAPLLCFFGDRDPYIPPVQVQRIDETLRRLGKTYEIKIYPGADHGFFCDERSSYHPEAAQDAWQKTKGWLEKHLRA